MLDDPEVNMREEVDALAKYDPKFNETFLLWVFWLRIIYEHWNIIILAILVTRSKWLPMNFIFLSKIIVLEEKIE